MGGHAARRDNKLKALEKMTVARSTIARKLTKEKPSGKTNKKKGPAIEKQLGASTNLSHAPRHGRAGD
jgi:hypothetical protein